MILIKSKISINRFNISEEDRISIFLKFISNNAEENITK